jgi:predicted TIM-barrel fold metal-dependent hydrolase
MIIDAHVHLGKSIFGYELDAETLLASMDLYEIDFSIVCPVQPFTYHLETENEYISNISDQYPKRLIGFCRIDPRQRDKSVLELQRSVSQLGLKGLFLHPWEEGYKINADFVVPVVQEAANLNIPVIVASGYPWLSHALQVADLAEQVPEAKIIMTNGGQINISGLAQSDAYLALRKHSNLYIETSGVYRQDFIENSIEQFGSDRVLFGSNAPRMNQGFELERAKSATKKYPEFQQDVLGSSTARLLNLQNISYFYN